MAEVFLTIQDSSTNITTQEDAFVVSLGTSGPQGGLSIENVAYVFTQKSPSTIWEITHGLQFIPSITVVDSAGSVVEGDYAYPNENTLIATFIGSIAGKAYLSWKEK